MCGIVGYSGKNPFDIDKIHKLILCNETRGGDATGMLSQGEVIKKAEDAVKFLSKNIIIPENKFIAHCRAGTVGNKADDNNAHPFVYNKIATVHNGTLKAEYDLAKIVGWIRSDYSVDSQVLAKIISEGKQIEGFKALDGAAALIWAHVDSPSTIFCYRNADRPLFRGIVEGEGMYLSSLEESLVIIGCTSIKEIKTHCIYQIEDGEIKSSTAITIPTKKTVSNNYNYGNGYENFDKGDWIKCVTYSAGLTVGDWYPVVDTRGARVYIINNNGKEEDYSSYFFRSPSSHFRVNGFSFFMQELDDENAPFQKGDIVAIKKIEYANDVIYGSNIKDQSKVWKIPIAFCRPVELLEEPEIIGAVRKIIKEREMSQAELDNYLELSENLFVQAKSTIEQLELIKESLENVCTSLDTAVLIKPEEIQPELEKICNDLVSIIEDIPESSIELSDDELRAHVLE